MAYVQGKELETHTHTYSFDSILLTTSNVLFFFHLILALRIVTPAVSVGTDIIFYQDSLFVQT